MNLKDGGKNRSAMRVIGTKGCHTVLQELGLWIEGMSTTEAREALWKWKEVTGQMTRLEQLFYDSKIVLLYETKSHPIFNPTEVLLL